MSDAKLNCGVCGIDYFDVDCPVHGEIHSISHTPTKPAREWWIANGNERYKSYITSEGGNAVRVIEHSAYQQLADINQKLVGECAELRKENDLFKKDHFYLDYLNSCQRADSAERERDTLREAFIKACEALEKYGDHYSGCVAWNSLEPCSCGLDKAISELAAIKRRL